jgi:hypothetical protein
MTGKKLPSVKPREKALLLAGRLVKELEALSRDAANVKSRITPVNLRVALRSAKKLRKMLLHRKDSPSICWKSILQGLELVAKIAERIYSLFNCQISFKIHYESRFNYKAAENS